MEYVEGFYEFLKSPWGGAVPCAFLGISAQLFSYKGLALVKSTGKKLDEFASEGIGYSVTVAIALLLFFTINKDIMIFLVNISLSFGFHFVFARYINPWLTRKGQGKG